MSGSIKFKKLIINGDYQTAMDVAKQQVNFSCTFNPKPATRVHKSCSFVAPARLEHDMLAPSAGLVKLERLDKG